MYRFLFKLIKKIFHKICILVEVDLPLKYLGTPYGGWYFSDKTLSKKPTLLSAGVGEDVSFDIEFLNNYRGKVYFVDPTAKSISHIDKVIENLGKPKSVEFDIKSGNQPIDAYDLSSVQRDDFLLIKKALYNQTDLIIKFFKPLNKEHVSHSISNYQNQFSKKTEYIEVTTTTVENIINQYEIDHIDILKLDIEGAENQVIPNLLKKKIFPTQILVEFDELTTSFISPYLNALTIFLKLKLNSYNLVKTNQFPNFLFVRK
jgi:FkbM family methyltransferase